MLDAVLFAAIVAFLKEQLGLVGKTVVLVAVAIGTIFWFQADIASAVPLLGKLLDYLKFVLAAPGLFDLVSNLAPKVAKGEAVG